MKSILASLILFLSSFSFAAEIQTITLEVPPIFCKETTFQANFDKTVFIDNLLVSYNGQCWPVAHAYALNLSGFQKYTAAGICSLMKMRAKEQIRALPKFNNYSNRVIYLDDEGKIIQTDSLANTGSVQSIVCEP